jgi:hypothetical protein
MKPFGGDDEDTILFAVVVFVSIGAFLALAWSIR